MGQKRNLTNAYMQLQHGEKNQQEISDKFASETLHYEFFYFIFFTVPKGHGYKFNCRQANNNSAPLNGKIKKSFEFQ